MPDSNSRLVYSTDGGRVIPPSSPRPAASPARGVPNDGVVRIRRETKGRGGKTVTVVTGLPGTAAALDALLKVLKQQCGTGGARDGSTLELQGDHRDRVEAHLITLGHRVKRAGG